MARASQVGQQAAGGKVSGQVTAACDGRAIRSAEVEILSLSSANQAVMSTDEFGRFEFADLAVGRYVVRARARGFASSIRRADARRGGWRIVDVATNQALANGDLALLRLGSVSGTLADRRGDPAVAVSVMAFVMERIGGVDRLMSVGANARSDDQGRYKLSALPENRYFILACPEAFEGAARPSDQSHAAYAPMFYGGSPWPSGALSVSVGAEQEVTDVNIRVEPLRTFTLSGVARSTDGKPLREAPLRLLPGAGVIIPIEQETSTSGSGEFTFGSLVPGDYTLETVATDEDVSAFGIEVVTIAGQMEPVTLNTRPARYFRGQIAAPDSGRLPDLKDVHLVATPVDFARSPVGLGARVSIDADHSFRIGPAWGPHLLEALMLPPGWILDRVEVNSQDYKAVPIDFDAFDPETTAIRVILSPEASTIVGTVVSGNGERVPYADVLLKVDGNRMGAGGIRRTSTTFDGAFAFEGLAAGRYRVLALEDPWASETSSSALDALFSRAQPLTLGRRDRQIVTAKITSPGSE